MRLRCRMGCHSFPEYFLEGTGLFTMIGPCPGCGVLVYDQYESGALFPRPLRWSSLTDLGKTQVRRQFPQCAPSRELEEALEEVEAIAPE